jgi:hypothetical protein
MNSALERRLVAVERLLMPTSARPLVVIVRGGSRSGNPTFAIARGLRWERAPGESFADFKSRAVDEAAAAGECFVVIRGLPGQQLRPSAS